MQQEGDGQMKKIVIVLALLMFVAGCAILDERYTGPNVRVEPAEEYDYTPMYSHYYSPYMWSGWYGWWSPYWLYGYYSPYGNYYNPYFWGWYYYPTRTGGGEKTIIEKGQLSKSAIRAIPRRTVTKTSRGTVRSRGSRSSPPRSGSGRAVSSRSGSSSSGRSSGGSRVIKKK
jgi:hypothetical protein